MASLQFSDGLPPVLSTEEVAQLLRLNPKTVLAMARGGRLPGHRLPGCRKVQYLTSEILATVAGAPGIEETGAHRSNGLPPHPAPTEVDPCDVWGPAPATRIGEDMRQRCLDRWIALASQVGVPEITVAENDPSEDFIGHQRSAGRVDIGGLLYEVLIGPRQRTRYVDDEGEVRWGLIDAVWVEPVERTQ